MKKLTIEKNNDIFHLSNGSISYIIGILKNKHLANYYFGETIEGHLTEDMFRLGQARPLTSNVYADDEMFTLSLEKLDYPVYGTTDYREPAIDLQLHTGSRVVDFKYDSHRVYDGKESISGIPSTYAKNSEEAKSLEITMVDQVTDIRLVHTYTVFTTKNVVSRKTKIINNNSSPVIIDRIMSMSMDISSEYNHWIQLSGDWARERHVVKRELNIGRTAIDSKYGSSSARNNPFVILGKEDTNEDKGEAIGISLVYSGNFLIQSETDNNKLNRIQCGINPFGFSWTVNSGDSFETPEALITYGSNGYGSVSKELHNLYNENLINQKWQNKPRPVLLNSWEATYFDFTEEALLDLAREGKEVGIDLFVLDDGWFGNRDSDKRGLGDWFVNYDKLPGGIKGLCEKVNDIGLDFGIWIEPEMVNPDSKLFSEHPDWIISDPNREFSVGRNQLVLDYSRDEVVNYIFDMLCKSFDGVNLKYVKWDMNRTITEPFSRGLDSNKQGELFHRYILNVYKLYDLLTKRYPNIMFESCSAGGNRFDPALLYYAPQVWTSDNTDAVDRLKIQEGTSMGYPLSSMGSHVSITPNHQTHRDTPLKFRRDVAIFGTFGYELDLRVLSNIEKEEVRQQVKFFKDRQNLLQYGDFYRLDSAFEGVRTAWMTVNKDLSQAIVGMYYVQNQPNDSIKSLKLKGLDSKKSYEVKSDIFNGTVSGSYLMKHGIIYKPSFNGQEKSRDILGDHQSYIIDIKEVI